MFEGAISSVHAVRSAPVAVITPDEMARRLKIGIRAAYTVIRKMRHKSLHGHIWTTEEWFAEWLAAETVPQMNWPTPGQRYDPLEEVIIGRVVQMVGELAARGKIRVLDLEMPIAV